MTKKPAGKLQEQPEAIYHSKSRRVLATLIRLLGNFEVAVTAHLQCRGATD